MKNLKRNVLIYSLALAAVAGGCGKSTEINMSEKVQEIEQIPENDVEPEKEEVKESEAAPEKEEVPEKEAVSEQEETPEKEAVSEQEEVQKDEAVTENDKISEIDSVQLQQDVQELAEKAQAAYLDILKAAPAIEGEPEELSDAAFDYEMNLEKFGEHYDCYAIADINRDQVPELIAQFIVNFRWTPVSVYTFADEKAVLLNDPLDELAHGTFEQCSTANGAYLTYICEENHIHNVWRGTNPIGEAAEDNYAYMLDGTKLILTDCNAGESEGTIYFQDIAKVNN